jgi:hypothetical protein
LEFNRHAENGLDDVMNDAKVKGPFPMPVYLGNGKLVLFQKI